MSILGIARTYRSLQRLIEIVEVLARHGFGHYVSRLSLQERFPRIGGWLAVRTRLQSEPAQDGDLSPARRITLALQELGPTFVKLGQMLSSRPDVVPENLIRELRKLQDDVEPFPAHVAIGIVEREVGQPIREVFSQFDEKPFASGSMAQVHYARLPDGTEVVVKVRRPDIEERVLLDLGWLRYLADLAETYLPELQPYRPVAIVDELERGIRRELDLAVEGSVTAKFHTLFRGDPDVTTPQVHWDLTTPHMLTLQRISGRSLSRFTDEEKDPAARRRVARTLAGAFCRQYFDFGTYHADPHPGNIIIDENGRLCLIDFGLTGHLSDELRSNLAQLLIALHRKELDIFCELFEEIGATTEGTDRGVLEADLLDLLDKYYNMPLKRVDTFDVFSDVTRIARRNGLVLPRDLILLAKSFAAVMTAAKNLDPDFDFAEAIEPHVRALAVRRFSPEFLLKETKTALWHLLRLARWMPREIADVLRKVQSGRLQLVFRHEGLDKWVTDLDRSLNRLSISIIIAAIVVGSSFLLRAGIGPVVLNMSVIGLFGYLFAGILGIALIVAIWRHGRL